MIAAPDPHSSTGKKNFMATSDECCRWPTTLTGLAILQMKICMEAYQNFSRKPKKEGCALQATATEQKM